MSDKACHNTNPHPPHAWVAEDSYTEWCNGPDQPMSDVQTQTAIRPNGRPYRARTAPTAEFLMWNDDGIAVVVHRTHDVALARQLALDQWERECDGPMPDPILEWMRTVPWDALGLGYDWTTLVVDGDTHGSWPTVRFGGDR